MRPADCKDARDAKKLNEQGFGVNENSIYVHHNAVILNFGNCTIKTTQRTFELLASWYLEDQEICDPKKL